MTTCTAARIIGPAHDRTEIGCDLHDGHAGDHIQRDAFGRGSSVTYAWTRTTLRVVPAARRPAPVVTDDVT